MQSALTWETDAGSDASQFAIESELAIPPNRPPSRGYHGLFIELKRDDTTIYLKIGSHKGELTSDPHIREQAMMLEHLNKLGYFARFGVGFEQCKRIIDWYLNPSYKESEAIELF